MLKVSKNETQTKCVEVIDLVPIFHPHISHTSVQNGRLSCTCLAAQVAGSVVIIVCDIFFVDVCVILCLGCVHAPGIHLRDNVCDCV